jgi:LmbE family N-acetylglucosaminyl deacetylase/VanZ family protein
MTARSEATSDAIISPGRARASDWRRKLWRYGPLIFWIALICYASSAAMAAPQTSRIIGPLLRWLFPEITDAQLLAAHMTVRKLAHLTEYAVLALLASRAFLTSSKEFLRRRWLAVSFALAASLALLDELNQSYTPTRGGSIRDSLLDVTGASLALACVALLRWRRARRHSTRGRSINGLTLLLVLCLVAPTVYLPPPGPARAQVRPVYEEGALGLGLLLRRLQTTASVLHVGAHPDDEDSALIARLARGDGARVAYLSLTRGEGGQNRIGPELFDALGVIRTEELLQARRLDGGEQFFTRAFDFGFTKTRAEAAARWNEREVLGDIVRVIRMFRPTVIVSRFRGTPEDGHGHHQFAGHLTPLAFRAAADPAQFPEQLAEGLRPWQAQKLYVSENLRARTQTAQTNANATTNANSSANSNTVSNAQAAATNATQASAANVLRIETGLHDPLLGRSHYELAMEGRSQHKSQGEGQLELRGPQASGLRLVERAPSPFDSPEVERDIFDGLDTSINGITRAARLAGPAGASLVNDLAEIQRNASHAIDNFNVNDPSTVLAALHIGLTRTRAARANLAKLGDAGRGAHGAQGAGVTADPARLRDADLLLARKESEFAEGLRLALGLRFDALADTETVARGDSLVVAVRAYAPESERASVASLRLHAPARWKVEEIAPPEGAAVGAAVLQSNRERATREAYFRITVAPFADTTGPYWLDRERAGDLYRWDADDPKSLPFAPPPLRAEVVFEAAGEKLIYERPVEHRLLDAVRGEVRRELAVVHELDVQLSPRLVVVPAHVAARGTTVEFTLQLTNNLGRTTEPAGATIVSGSAGLVETTGGQDKPTHSQPFSFTRKGERATLKFRVPVRAGTKPGAYGVRPGVFPVFHAEPRPLSVRGFEFGERVLDYPHITARRYHTRQEADVRVFDLRVADVRVGYVMGSGDEVPEALRRMGLSVTLLEEADLAVGDLSRFDTVVVGVRASQTRPDFVANHRRLVEFVEHGGALVVQYQRPDYAEQNLAPFPAAMQLRDARGVQTISRVVDETAPVRILEPAHAAFTRPNRITAADFAGWVQERNLYNFVKIDPRYTPLLESHDAGETENRGGMVYARVGRGHYVYTSYSFFRQLPAGVPGAYRLFANLVSLPKSSAAAPHRRR